MTVWLAPIKRGFTLVSEEDIPLLQHKWAVVKPDGKKAYVTAWIGGRTVYLHRLVTGAQKGQEVDHINGDGLDNSRPNLRIATRQQNCVNRRNAPESGFRGVYAQPSGRLYQTKIKVGGKNISGGNFASPEDAARRYDELAREHFGQFAILNFPETVS